MHPMTFGFTLMNTQVYIMDEELSKSRGGNACCFQTLKTTIKTYFTGGYKSDIIASESPLCSRFQPNKHDISFLRNNLREERTSGMPT